MKELSRKNQEIIRCEVSALEAVNIFKKMGESYKVETKLSDTVTRP